MSLYFNVDGQLLLQIGIYLREFLVDGLAFPACSKLPADYMLDCITAPAVGNRIIFSHDGFDVCNIDRIDSKFQIHQLCSKI